MWEYVEPIQSDELYHYGTLGMKWGRRLYQRPDGSLTSLGRKRYGTKSNFNRAVAANESIAKKKAKARTDAEVAKYRKKAKEEYDKERSKIETKKPEVKKEEPKPQTQEQTKSQTQEQTKPKTVSEMTDKELQDRINRLTAEQNYNRLVSQMNPKTTSRGRKFLDKLINNSLDSLAKNVGDAVGAAAKNYVNKTLGGAISKSLNDEQKKEEQQKKQQKKQENK